MAVESNQEKYRLRKALAGKTQIRGKDKFDLGDSGVSVIVGRLTGWVCVILAIIMASAEAVMALGTGAYSGLATSDVWTLLVGQSPGGLATSSGVISTAGSLFMAMPAWLVFGFSGFALVHVCRMRRQRRRRFKTVN